MADTKNFLDDDFKQWLESLLIEYHVPGMSIAVVDGDNIESAGYGMARIPNQPATANTIWAMASTTKAFTAVLLGLVMDDYNADKKPDSKVSFATPVSSIIPDEFVLEDPYLTANLTLEDLLSHRSGLPSFNMNLGDRHGISDLANIMQGLRYLGSPAHPLRTQWVYNNTGYSIVGRVVEKLARKPFPVVLQEKILDPLKMQATYTGTEAISVAIQTGKLDQGILACGYAWDGQADNDKAETGEGEPDEKVRGSESGYYTAERYTCIRGSGPAGDLFSNVNDYAKWAQALLRSAALSKSSPSDSKEPKQSEKGADELISSQIWTEVTTPRIVMLPVQEHIEDFQKTPPNAHLTPRTYALGWHTDPFMYPDTHLVEHGGGMPGFGSGVALVPELKLGIIMASNSMEIAPKIWQGLKKEFIGKKLGILKNERRKRTEKASAPPDPATAEEQNRTHTDSAEVSSDQQEAKADAPGSVVTVRQTDGPEELDRLKPPNLILQYNNEDVDLGSHYHHPALGTFGFRLLDDASAGLNSSNPSIDGNKIRRGSGSSAKEGKKSSTGTAGVIQAYTADDRALDLCWLLHFRGIPVEDTTGGRKYVLVYDLEELLRRGDRSKDPVKFLSTNNGSDSTEMAVTGSKDDEKYPLLDKVIWTRFRLKKKGGVVVFREVNKETHTKKVRYEVDSIGMSLGMYRMFDSPDQDSEGELRLDPGWEQRISWFHRVHLP